MSQNEALVRRCIALVIALGVAYMLWKHLIQSFDLGWLFITSFFVVLAQTVWPKKQNKAPRH